MARLAVGVLRGGPSSEYDVSLKSGASILEHLNRDKYLPVDVFIDKAGAWHVGGTPVSPERAVSNLDAAIIAMHGEYGEDGRVQRVLERFRVPYTGSDSVSSSVAFNKILTKESVLPLGIKTPRHRVLEVSPTLEREILELFRTFPQPSVVKPATAGSSVGVRIARNFEELREGVFLAFNVSPKVLIEEYIPGREATCGVVDRFRGKEYYSLFPIEIVPPPHKSFFDYEAKYDGSTKEICPGNFSRSENEELQRLAEAVHRSLRLRHYSRSDFIIGKRGIYFLEVNTLPGLTKESLLPKALSACGCSFSQFLDHLVSLARSR